MQRRRGQLQALSPVLSGLWSARQGLCLPLKSSPDETENRHWVTLCAMNLSSRVQSIHGVEQPVDDGVVRLDKMVEGALSPPVP